MRALTNSVVGVNKNKRESIMKNNKLEVKSAAVKPQSIIMELFYRKEGVPGTRIFTGEITAEYTTPSGIGMLELTQIDPETGDWKIFNIRAENIKHKQPKRMI